MCGLLVACVHNARINYAHTHNRIHAHTHTKALYTGTFNHLWVNQSSIKISDCSYGSATSSPWVILTIKCDSVFMLMVGKTCHG